VLSEYPRPRPAKHEQRESFVKSKEAEYARLPPYRGEFEKEAQRRGCKNPEFYEFIGKKFVQIV